MGKLARVNGARPTRHWEGVELVSPTLLSSWVNSGASAFVAGQQATTLSTLSELIQMVNARPGGLRAIRMQSLTTSCACHKMTRAPLVSNLDVLSMRSRLETNKMSSFGVRS